VGTVLLIAGKDLEIEWRSRVTTARVLPFAGVLVLLFAIALDPDRGLLPRVAPGLFWLAAVLAALLAIGRAFAVERENRAGVTLLLSGVDPAAMYLGKTLALAVELLVLEVLVGVGMVALYDVTPRHLGVLAGGAVVATAGIATAGTLYGAVVVSDRGRESLLALLLLPVLVPVLLGATRLFETALVGGSDAGLWMGLLAIFAALYGGVGALVFGALIEEA
jgi:heme exporter protein B